MPRPLSTTFLLMAGVACSLPIPAPASAEDAIVTPLISEPLSMDGKEGLMALVEYPPGASTQEHRHDAHVFVYVLEGSVVMQVAGREPVTLTAGDTFYEAPGDVHAVSENASDTQAARFLVFFVKDADKPPVIPVR